MDNYRMSVNRNFFARHEAIIFYSVSLAFLLYLLKWLELRFIKYRHVRIIFFMKIFLVVFLAFFSNNIFGQTQALALTHISVINMASPHVLKDRTVVISDGKIIFIGKKYQDLKNCTTLDCKGKYLIPGLWDMHSHMIWKVRLPIFLNLYIANGVTGVRDMGSSFSEFLEYKKWKLNAQETHADIIHIITPGTFLDGPVPTNAAAWAIKDTVDARKKVDELKEQGVDFIKVYNLLTRDVYFAIADEAKKQNLTVAGHLPFSIHIDEAMSAGQKSIEHLNKCILLCSSQKDSLEEQLRLATINSNAPQSWQAREKYDALALQTKDDRIADALYKSMKRHGLYQCPTLVLRSFFADTAAIINYIHQPYLNYYPEGLKNDMLTRYNGFFKIRNEEDDVRATALLKESLVQVKKMNDAGVDLLAGTDTPGFGTFPGISLHEELALFVKAGLSPYQALKTATVNPAKYTGQLNTLGTVEQGKIADLVILDANPLEDIHNTQKIYAVILNGKMLDRGKLDQLLKELEIKAGH